MGEQVQTGNKMGYAKMFPLIMSMALPAMFSMTVMALYNVVDSIFVGHLSDGTVALEATSYAYPLQMLLISFAVGTAVGINSLIARRLGAGKQKEADSVAAHGILLGLITWVIFIFVGLFAVKPFLLSYGCSGKTLEYGIQYLSVVLTLSGFSIIQVTIEKTLQATGDMFFPMLFQLAGAVTNLIFDPLFIYGIGPFPELRVMGAAVATVLGQFVGMVFALIVLFNKKNKITVTFKNFKFSGKTVKDIYAVGIPSIIMQSISSFMIIGMNAILSGYRSGVTILGIYFKLQSFIFMPCFGLNQGVLPVMGFNYGAKNKQRLYSAMKCGIAVALVIMLAGTALFWAIPDKLCALFNSDPQLIADAVPAFRAISLCFPFAAVGIIFISLFQATGKGIRALIISFTRQLVFILPIAFIISRYFELHAVWLAFPFAEIGSMALAIALFVQLTKTDFKKLDN